VSGSGIDFMEVRKDEAVIDRLEKKDLPLRITNPSDASELFLQDADEAKLSNAKEMLLRISKVNFEKGRWTFSDGKSKFGAEIEDEAFNEKVRQRQEAFYAGDTLHVMLRTTQKLGKDNKLDITHVIERVLRHTHALQEPSLFLNSGEDRPEPDAPKVLPPSRE
jgi:anthranilate/para-aminobenzoate synthase component I